MSTQKKLISLCFATVFTLGLAACGGGGGDAPVASMMDGDGSPEGKYILSGTMIPVEDVPNIVITVDSGESETFAGLGTVECASDEGCSGTVVDGVLTIMGDLLIVNVDPDLDSETATVLAGLAVDMLPDAPDPAIGQREAISSAIAAANTAVGVVTDAATDEEVAAADTAIAAAKMAIADAANVPAEEAAANSGTVSVLETALANAKTSRTAVIAAAAAAEVVRLAAEAAEAEAATKAVVTKAAGTKAKAIGEVKPDNMPLDVDVDVTVTADRAGPEIKVEGDDDFTHVMGPMYSLMHDADDDGNVVQEIVLVDHTITAPKRTSFAKEHTLNVSTDTTNDAGGVTNEALMIGAGSAPLVKLDGYAAGPGVGESEHTLKAEDTSADNMVDAAEVVGTYDGAPGTYRCNGDTDCTVTLARDAMGEVTTAVTGDWIFTPNPGAKVYVVDTEYTSFGVWLRRTTDADGVLTYNMVDTFATGMSATTAVAGVTGTASYKGSALGVYVHNVLDLAGEVASATGGSFTADATLTATFMQTEDDQATMGVNEGGQIAPIDMNTISGTINNFELAGGEQQNWSVELMRSEEYGVTVDGVADVAFAGKTKGGGAEGDYSGRFYGGTGDAGDVVAPGEVAGEFTANLLNGNVAGGFGATKQDD